MKSKNKTTINLFGPAPNLTMRPFGPGPSVDFSHCLKLLNQGLVTQAEAALKQVLQRQPQHADALQMSAMLRMKRADWAGALGALEQVLTISGAVPATLNNLGLALRELGRYEEAIAAFDKALSMQAGYAAAWINKGNSLRRIGRPQDAIQVYRSALEHLSSPDPRLLHALGLCQQDIGQLEPAINSLRQALTFDPNLVETYYALGTVLEQAQRFEEAIQSFEEVLHRVPNHHKALNGLGLVQQAMNRTPQAIEAFQAAISAQPQTPDAYANLAALYVDMKRFDPALQLYRKAQELGADRLGILQHIGELHADQRQFSLASQAYADICATNPAFDFALVNCFSNSMKAWDWNRAISLEADLLDGLRKGSRKALPFDAISFFDDPVLHLQVAKRYVQDIRQNLQVAKPLATPLAPNPDQRQRIRVAYVSADFHEHATMHLMKDAIELHDHMAFEWIAVSLGADLSERHRQWLLGTFDQVVDARSLSDDALAEQLRAMQLDIAVDLKGHTREARFVVFERRIAPIQVSYLGYPGTTGSTEMDYLLGDDVVTPVHDQAFYTEKIWNLPGCYQANTALSTAATPPQRQEEGIPAKAFVFACFNNSYKITAHLLNIWLRLLRAVPHSVLWLLANEPDAQARLQHYAAQAQIDPERIVFAPRKDRAAHLARLALVDLFLDTAPYGAHTTASDALRCGGVMITCTGHAFAAKVGASLLTAIDCTDLITRSWEDYEALSLKLALDPAALEGMRQKVRHGIRHSDLFDPAAFARKIENAFRCMVRGITVCG